jgi:hypothetical protein
MFIRLKIEKGIFIAFEFVFSIEFVLQVLHVQASICVESETVVVAAWARYGFGVHVYAFGQDFFFLGIALWIKKS